MTTPNASVILLNYNGAAFLDRCFDALERLRYPNWELIVVDNASDDGSRARIDARLKRFPSGVPTRSIHLPENRGYAGGHNTGAAIARGEYLAFLNVTCVVGPEWLSILPQIDPLPDVGFAQTVILSDSAGAPIESMGSLLTRDGSLRVLGRRRTLIDAPLGGSTRTHDVWSIHGAAFVARRAVFESLGGFDERFFLYFEETDLCWRGWLIGQRSVCCHTPGTPMTVVHTTHGTAPNRWRIDELFDRNRTISMFRNLETRHVGYILLNAVRVTTELARQPRYLWQYYREVLARIPEAIDRRRAIQRSRRVPDARLYALGEPDDLDALTARPAVTTSGSPPVGA